MRRLRRCWTDEAFYAHCRALLTDVGCMTVNLFGRASSYERSLDKISAAFGEGAVWAFKPTREGNTVVLAQRTPVRPPLASCLPSGPKPSRLAGACPPPDGCGCSNR
jgi:spermidine synthase